MAFFLAQRNGVKSSSMTTPSRLGWSNVNSRSCECECAVVPEKVAPGGSQLFVLCRRYLVPGNYEGGTKDQKQFKRRA